MRSVRDRIFVGSLLLSIIFFLNLSYAQSDGGSQKPGLMGGGGASAGGASGGGTALPDLFTGTMSHTIPIEVPPGRKGMDPGLALIYRSGSGDGWLGVGWELEVGAIERGVKFGVDYGGDVYLFRMAGATIDLVNVGNEEYRAKIENAFSRIKRLPASDGRTYWEVTDKVGTRYFFGQTSASRQDNPANADHIFRWSLDRVEDTNGNFMTFGYFKNQGQIYLDRLDYAGNGTVAPSNYVKFYLESRSDAPAMYTTNFEVQDPFQLNAVRTAYRLKTIDVVANATRVRAYKLVYSQGANTNRSRLESVQQFGSDAVVDASGTVTGGTALPLDRFSYSEGSTGFANTQDWSTNPYNAIVDAPSERVLNGDFNGDGKTDIAWGGGSGQTHWVVSLSNQNGTGFIPQSWSTAPYVAIDNPTDGHEEVVTGDFNGDGKTDIAHARSLWGAWRIAISTGSGFVIQDWSTAPYMAIDNRPDGHEEIVTGDFNGDGKTDIAHARSQWGFWRVSLSTGSGFVTQEWSIGGGLWAIDNRADGREEIVTGDFNGDGKTDIAHARNLWTFWRVSLSTGSGFTTRDWELTVPGFRNAIDNLQDGHEKIITGDFNGDGRTDIARARSGWGLWRVSLSANSYFATEDWGVTPTHLGYYAIQNLADGHEEVVTGDFNGDGKTDIAHARSQWGAWQVSLSIGDKLIPVQEWSTSPYAAIDARADNHERVVLGDFNGDGKTDLAHSRSQWTFWRVSIVNPSLSDLLVSITNRTGAVFTISYVPSTQYTNTQLPFPVQVVDSIIADNGNGVTSTTKYSYSDGFYYIPERDFRGFRNAIVRGPIGPDGMTNEGRMTITKFLQGNDNDFLNFNVPVGAMKGKPYRVQVIDENGMRFQVDTRYAPNTSSPYYFSPLQYVDKCEGDSCNQNTQSHLFYDSYGNLTEERLTDFSNPDNNRTTVWTFSPNPDAWIVGLPTKKTIYQGIGTTNKVAETSFTYDSGSAPATVGNLTAVASWLNTAATNPTTQFSYDQYGNQISIIDANGHPTAICFDASGTFPQMVTDALGYKAKMQYYGIPWNTNCDAAAPPSSTGTGLYGQMKSMTDPNNATTTSTYDVFGRKVSSTSPAPDAPTTWSYNSFGTVGQQHVQSTTGGISTWTYFDGFGRTILEKRTGPDGKKIATQTFYNNKGLVDKTSLPYFENIETPIWQTFIYDGIGRLTQVTNPDGSRVLQCHNAGVTVVIDANNHRKRETRDVFGRLVRVDEYQSTFSTCGTGVDTPYAMTTYQYDVLGNLLKVTDAKGNLTTMRYDTLGRKIAMSDPDMGNCGDLTSLTPNPQFPWYPAPCWNYKYDAVGNLMEQRDGKSQSITFSYDALNRIIQKTAGVPPTTPSNLVASTASSSQINLTWTSSTGNVGVTGYRVERCQGASCTNFVQIATSTGTSFNNTGLTAGVTYRYRVSAVDAAENISAYSNIATATATNDTQAPSAPSTLTATAASATQVTLTWTASTDNVGVSRYEVERKSNNGQYVVISSPTINNFTDNGVSGSTTYLYRVRAFDAAGNASVYSNIDLATTILFTDDPLVAGAAGTFVKAAHLTELRQAVNAVRAAAGLAAAAWTDATLIGIFIKAVHIQELRDHLAPALAALGLTAPSYTDPILTAGSTVVKKAHLEELRQAVE